MKKKPIPSPPPGKNTPLQEREAYWQKQVESWRGSGLSQSAYSRENGLRSNQLSYWYRKQKRAEVGKRPETGSGFIPLHVEVASQEESVTVCLPNGVKIEGVRDQTLLLAKKLVAEL